MSASDISWSAPLEILIVVAVLALILRQQMRWRPVSRALRTAALLCVGGLVLVTQQIGRGTEHLLTDPVVIAYLVLTSIVALAGGLVMGVLSATRVGADGEQEMRGGWSGLALWVVYLALRVGMSIAVTVIDGPQISRLTGLVLLSIGLARLVSAVVVTVRARPGTLDGAPSATAQTPSRS